MRLMRGAVIVGIVGALGLILAVTHSENLSVTADTGTAVAGTGTAASCPGPPSGSRTNGGPPAHAMGTIAAINGTTSFTVTGQNNTSYTVSVDANTHYDKTVISSFGAIAVGDTIMAQGTTPSAGTFAATAITDNGKRTQRPGGSGGPGGPNGNAQHPPSGTPPALPAECKPPQRPQQAPANQATSGTVVAGTVQQITGTTLTISARGGKTVTVTTDGSTKVTAHQQGAFADLKVGDQVAAGAAPKSGTAATANAFTAAFVSDRTVH